MAKLRLIFEFESRIAFKFVAAFPLIIIDERDLQSVNMLYTLLLRDEFLSDSNVTELGKVIEERE